MPSPRSWQRIDCSRKGQPLLSRHLNRNVQQFLNLYWDALPFMRIEDWQRQTR